MLVDQVISSDHVKNLASKLDAMSLPDEERKLLSALVNLGREETMSQSSLPVRADLMLSIHDQFTKSFSPGSTGQIGSVTLKIGR